MYSEKIKSKIQAMFADLRNEARELVDSSDSLDNAVNSICKSTNRQVSLRSKTMLNDMLFELEKNLLQSDPFFADVVQKNKFMELNLQQEISSKYQFATQTEMNYQEISRIKDSIKIGGGVFVVGAICEVGGVLVSGLSFTALAPVPVGVLVAVALGAAMINYLAIVPKKNKENFSREIEKFLNEVQQQFLNWFDEIEKYFHQRVQEIKQTI